MVIVQIRTVREDEADALQAVELATIQITGEEVTVLSGNPELFHFEMKVPSPRLRRWISFDEDREEWARNLGQVYRMPDFEAVVVEDTNPFELPHVSVPRQDVVLSAQALQEA